MATLFKNTLNPNLIVFVEWANEPWNSVFQVTQDSYTIGQQLYNSGGYDFLDYDSMFYLFFIVFFYLFFYFLLIKNADSGNIYYMAYRWTVWKALGVSNIWRQVWGDCNMNTRVRPVINAQVSKKRGKRIKKNSF